MRQSVHNIDKTKIELRKVQQAKHSGKSSNEEKIKTAHIKYISKVRLLLTKVEETKTKIIKQAPVNPLLSFQLLQIEKYMQYANQQINLIERRVLQGEIIPHFEKIFSIFEEFTRWISKGKQGVFVEFGLPVSIIRDHYGYILVHEVMEKSNDVDVAIPLTERAKQKYSSIKSVSSDKGFWSPSNRKLMGELVEIPVMPKKGRCNKAEKAEESSEEFKELRKKHSAVESTINGLGHSGLDKCKDHGITGFKRCVSLSILARNIQTLGNQIQAKEIKRKRRKKHKRAA